MAVHPALRVLASVTILAVGACEAAPSRPSVSFATPQSQGPAAGSSFGFAQQPVVVTLNNVPRATGAGAVSITYDIEVATTTSFAPLVATVNAVPETPGLTTAVTLPALEGGRTYHWRSRAVVDATPGAWSAAGTFIVRPAVVIQAPEVVSPADAGRVFTGRPTFVVRNASRTGDAGVLSYEFQVSSTATFGTVAASGTVLEGATQTAWTPTVDLPLGFFYWRARAADTTNQVTGPYSASPVFERRPATGDFFDLSTATIVLGSTDIATWPVAAQVSSASISMSQVCVNSTALSTWPSTIFFDDPAEQVQGNQWMFAFINGRWYGGAGRWTRPGQACKDAGGEPFSGTFYQDQTEPLRSYVPRVGDTIGLMVTTPNRFYPAMRTVDQRTNVILVQFGS